MPPFEPVNERLLETYKLIKHYNGKSMLGNKYLQVEILKNQAVMMDAIMEMRKELRRSK